MSLSSKIETAANAATIVVALLLSAVLVRIYLLPKPRIPRPTPPTTLTIPQATTGTNMKPLLRGVDWAENGRTLVLAISTQCHFCAESAPFFRTLGQQLSGKVKLVAALPQAVTDSQRYLKREGVRVDKVLQAPPAAIGVRGTPTMLLVNGAGVVTNVWVGELQPAQQKPALRVLDHAPAEGGNP